MPDFSTTQNNPQAQFNAHSIGTPALFHGNHDSDGQVSRQGDWKTSRRSRKSNVEWVVMR
jgi:hypothetical protein